MKKIISVILILSVLFCLVSCRSTDETDSSAVDSLIESVIEKPDESSEDTTTSEIVSDTVSENSSVESSTPESSASSKVNSSSKPATSSVKQPAVSNNTSSPAVKTKPNFGKFAYEYYSLADMLKAVPHYTFKSPGTIVDYVTVEDLIYVIYHNSFKIGSFINLFDAKAGKIVYSHTLPSRPAEIHIYGNELWISFPELSHIYIYNKSNFELLDKISTGVNVGSFDKYNDYIFYGIDDDRHFVNRYDIKNKVIESLFSLCGKEPSVSDMFHEPAILIDKNTATLYIAETGLTDCQFRAYNIATMEEIGFLVDDSAHPWYPNSVRKIILADDFIYWSNLKIKNAPKEYWQARFIYGNGGTGILYADKDYVATYIGVYENNTGKKILRFPETANYHKAYKFSITKCKNIMISDPVNLYIFYG